MGDINRAVFKLVDFPNLMNRKIRATDYSTFVEKMDAGAIKEVMVKSGQIYFTVLEMEKN